MCCRESFRNRRITEAVRDSSLEEARLEPDLSRMKESSKAGSTVRRGRGERERQIPGNRKRQEPRRDHTPYVQGDEEQIGSGWSEGLFGGPRTD